MLPQTTYYQQNKERILEKAKTKVTCECGAVISYANRGFHRKSTKHVIWKQQGESAKRQSVERLDAFPAI